MRKQNRTSQTIDFRDVLSLSPKSRMKFAKTPEGQNYLEALTPTQYAQLFPDYYRKRLPDIGQAMSGVMPGRRMPSFGIPGIGTAPRAGTRAAERTIEQSGQPDTAETPPGQAGRSRPQKQQRETPIWQGGTPQVNRTDELPRRGSSPPGSVELDLKGETDLSRVSVTQRRLAVYNTFRKQGLNHASAVMLTGEMGRENDFRASRMFGNHEDSSRWNTGIMSWNSDRPDMNIDSRAGRRGRLIAFLDSKGLMKGNDIVPTQAALDAQVEFLVKEMETGSHIGSEGNNNQKAVRVRELLKKMRDPNAQLDYEETHRILGNDLIRWAYDRLPHHRQRMAEHERALQKEYEIAKKVPDNAGQEGDSYLPGLALLDPKALAGDKKENPPTPTRGRPTASRVYIGDSFAGGLGSADKGSEVYANEGDSPSAVLNRLKGIAPEKLKGKRIVLSTGLANNPKDVDSVRKQLEHLKSIGVDPNDVVIVGGPQGEKARPDLVGINDTVSNIAKEFNFKFGGGFVPGGDGVHPEEYSSYNSVIDPVASPIRRPGLPQAQSYRGKSPEELLEMFPENSQRFFHEKGRKEVNPKLIEAIKEASRDLPAGYHVRMFSGRDARVGTRNHPGGAAIDLAIIDDQGRKLADRGFGPGHKIYEQLAHSMNMRGKQMYPETNWLWGGSWTAAGGDRMHYQIVDPENPVAGASRGMTQYSWGSGVQDNHWAGARDAWMTRDELKEYKKRIAEKMGRELTASENAELETRNASAIPIQQRGITSVAGLTGGQQDEDSPHKLMFNTGRAYTENEVKSMVDKYGKNLVIGANMDTPDEYARVQELAKKYGIKAHGYSMGRGAPQDSWGNNFPKEQKEVQRRASERGISLDKWYSGGWLDYEMDRLKSLGDRAPSQVEFDNLNDAKNIEEELLRYDRFRKESGIGTRIVPKNFTEREYTAYNNLVQQKKISPDILVPLNIVESQYVKGSEKITQQANHSYGNMPEANIKGYATKEPLSYNDKPEIQTMKAEATRGAEVQKNEHGGVMHSPTGERFSIYDHKSGETIGTVSPGERADFSRRGQIEVTPENRTYPGDIIDKSMERLAQNRADAMEETADNNQPRESSMSQSISPTNSNWRSMMAHMTEPRTFDSASFHRATAASRFQKVGDPVIGGHFDEFSTAIS